MNSELLKVIPAIISNIVKGGGDHAYVTKTKLLKLLYLFDVEYYRVHRETFTSFDWIFYELGPWTQEYYAALDEVQRVGAVTLSPSKYVEHETEFFRADFVDIFGLLDNHSDEGILRTVLNAWGNKTTADILDYVYFETEPMEFGERYKPLDFSLIPLDPPVRYNPHSSDKTPEQIRKLKVEFKKRQSARPSEVDRKLTTPPKYDEAFFALLADLEKEH